MECLQFPKWCQERNDIMLFIFISIISFVFLIIQLTKNQDDTKYQLYYFHWYYILMTCIYSLLQLLNINVFLDFIILLVFSLFYIKLFYILKSKRKILRIQSNPYFYNIYLFFVILINLFYLEKFSPLQRSIFLIPLFFLFILDNLKIK